MTGTGNSRPPWGAVAVIAIGLLATAAAALLSTEGPLGSTTLGWRARASLPASRPAVLPGGGHMRLADVEIAATEANGSGYRLYRVAAVLGIRAGTAQRRGRLRCTVRVPALRALIAHTPESRAIYPLPSSELSKQPVPRRVSIEFSAGGAELARVGLGDAFDHFASQHGITVEWVSPGIGRQGWEWRLPPRRPAQRLRLAFASIWRTPDVPAARIYCTLANGSGTATVRTAGSLEGLP